MDSRKLLYPDFEIWLRQKHLLVYVMQKENWNTFKGSEWHDLLVKFFKNFMFQDEQR
jgi:hypothetical protein